ncbi:MAG: TldD/PmbA family protein [Bacteroidales bacterium]|nr:TldD/PmbA family protein [Bacteroidales bacterium]
MLSRFEKDITRRCMAMALEAGAQKVRVNLSGSAMDLVASLDGGVDKVTACLDRSLEISIFADGRFGAFSTNRLDEESLRKFISEAVRTVRMLAPDPCRDLPSPERQVKNALTGDELDLYDPAYEDISPEKRRGLAMQASVWPSKGKGWKLISEEGEYSDTLEYNYTVDSGGLDAFHRETCFSYGVEVTIEDSRHRKYSGYWWDSCVHLRDLDVAAIGRRALETAVAQIGSRSIPGGRRTLVLDSEISYKAVSPILAALGGYNLQQQNSFLQDCLGKKVFPDGMTLLDCPHRHGENGSRLFDSEGIATRERPIIENGVVKEYFLNTYMANKLGMAPTQEEATRPYLLPFCGGGQTPENRLAPLDPTVRCAYGSPSYGAEGGTGFRGSAASDRLPFGRDEILQLCNEGILVTDFNGGNSNIATGDFSYGIEGFEFREGKIVRPVSGMLITGNFLQLWQGLIAAGDDSRPCKGKLIPTLAFRDVDFSGE